MQVIAQACKKLHRMPKVNSDRGREKDGSPAHARINSDRGRERDGSPAQQVTNLPLESAVVLCVPYLRVMMIIDASRIPLGN